MDQKNEQIVPLRIKNLAGLKRCIRPGTELVATSHSKHPALVGLVRVVTEVQTNAYYSVVKDQPTHQYSTCNYGKGFRSDFEKASNYLFEGTTIKVLDRRSGDGSVLYEMELYPGECLVLGQKNDMEENADTMQNYTLDASPAALGLASNEYVTQFMVSFGVVPSNFRQVEAPRVYCNVVSWLTGGTQFVNQADVGGVYDGQWIMATSRWVTKVYKPSEPLPRTGY